MSYGIKKILWTGIVLTAWIPGIVRGQIPFEETAPHYFRIEFMDKNGNSFTLDHPETFLSNRSLLRRQRQHIPINESDLPVSQAYIDSIRSAGAIIYTVSKWMNAATVYLPSDSLLDRIARFTFVKKGNFPLHTLRIMHAGLTKPGIQELCIPVSYNYGASYFQNEIHKGNILHDHGYTGKGITIAVIDAGFYHADQLQAFETLWQKGQILGSRDFVSAGSNVFEGNAHGMEVLSILAGNLPGELIGTAPDADYWLLRSENVASEYIIEEDNWIAAAEFADSAGADIISTSLGYSQFQDTLSDHTYADMNGHTTRISRAAGMAASKGMLVVVSAGNQGTTSWHYITAPADADSVLAVGAVDTDGLLAPFSGRGPSADGRVKPDVLAVGWGTVIVNSSGSIQLGNGTSFSTPVIAGLSACLWQAVPDATCIELVTTLRKCSDRFASPDPDYGFGIPDFNLAESLLHMQLDEPIEEEGMVVFPNPFTQELYLVFTHAFSGAVDVSLFSSLGKLILRRHYDPFPGREYLLLDSMNQLPVGFYVLRIDAPGHVGVFKVIKK